MSLAQVLLLHVFSCWLMTGVIWLVQLLVYPNFQLISSLEFQSFHDFHLKRITWVVLPAMGVELLSGVWLLWQRPDNLFFWNLLSVVALWMFTALVSVPQHNGLSRNPAAAKGPLINFNWPRTLIWSMRSAFWLWLLQKNFSEILT